MLTRVDTLFVEVTKFVEIRCVWSRKKKKKRARRLGPWLLVVSASILFPKHVRGRPRPIRGPRLNIAVIVLRLVGALSLEYIGPFTNILQSWHGREGGGLSVFGISFPLSIWKVVVPTRFRGRVVFRFFSKGNSLLP